MKNATVLKLEECFKGDLTEYKSIPFWSWNNDLEADELVRQIDEMYAAGMGGFIMHARMGLPMEYLGEKWFSCIEACLKRAKELNMKAWVYDENGWPSGFVGGKLLENKEYLAQYLEYEVKDSFDTDAFAVYKNADGAFIRLEQPQDDVSEYHTVYLRTSPSNTDILNPAVTDAFIRETHEQYYKRFKESFGKELAGFFTDEPQYYRWGTPYTKCAKEVFEQKYHEDIRDGLVYLFVHNKNGYSFRTKYFSTLNELYVNNFYKRLYHWCEDHNCMLTGHSVEETSLSGQMFGCAGVMPSYEFEHIPAIDWLGRDCANEAEPKQIGSVASQLGKKLVLTETFAGSGYDVTPRELKSIGEYQYFNGVSKMCHHLYPYSLSGQGKRDYPPVFSRHGNWGTAFKDFNDYFTHLGYIVSNTNDEYDLLVIHPLKSAYLEYVRDEDMDSIRGLEESFSGLLETLRKQGINYQFADESILAKYGKLDGNELVIGNNRYAKVLVPHMQSIASSTYALLKDFKGSLLVMDESYIQDGGSETVRLHSNTTMEEIHKNAKFRFRCEDGRSGINARSGELGKFIFIKNYSRTEKSKIVTEGIADHYKILDLETMKLRNFSDEYTLEGCEGLILVEDDDAKSEVVTKEKQDITSAFKITDLSENYAVLDHGCISKDGEHFGTVCPLPRIADELLREEYRGKLYIQHEFFLDDRIDDLVLMTEKNNRLFSKLNGQELVYRQSDFDINFEEADISKIAVVGKNTFVYELDYYQHDGVYFALFDPEATESVKNCLYYDTYIENIILKGSFTVADNFHICKKQGLPPVNFQSDRAGYPFFYGNVQSEGVYEYDGKHLVALEVTGRYLVTEIYVNGKKRNLLFDNKTDITDLLTVGKNTIRLVVRYSPRNLFGPHHYKLEKDPVFVGPGFFIMTGTWQNGESPYYTDEFNFIPFGTKNINIIQSK